MAPDDSFKYFGLLSLILLFFGLSFIVIKWPRGRQYTFSQHIAQYTSSILYYILLFSIALPLLVLFFLEWFSPTFGMAWWFTIWLILAAIFQLLCAFIPEVGRRRVIWHKWLAGISAFCLQPPILIVTLASQFQTIDRVIAGVSFATMFTLMIFMTINRAQHSNFLAIQAGYYVAFFAPFIAISYL